MIRDGADRVRSLTARLLGLLTFALFPLALISLYQTQSVINEAEALSRSALLGETERAASSERELLREALGAGQGLGAMVLSANTTPASCDTIMANFVDLHDDFIFAGFIQSSGIMECASRGDTVDFSKSPNWAAVTANPQIQIASNMRGEVTGQAVIITSHPIFEGDAFKGYVSISIPHNVANQVLPEYAEIEDFWLSTLNADGEILSSSIDIESAAQQMPADVVGKDLINQVDQVFNAASLSGVERKYAIVPIFKGKVYALGSWPLNSGRSSVLTHNTGFTLIFPILMWLVGIAVAWLGLHNLVIRHIHEMRDAMRRFTLGEREHAKLSLFNPPEELAEAERAFNRMITILTEAEERREADLLDKSVLLREVHHRVKNNLQLIASITNMQMRQVRTDESRRVLSQLQRRVRGLATIHQSLYSTPDLTMIDARKLVENMVAQMDQIGGRTASAPVVHTNLDSAMLYPDQAVPLSMLVAEALNNAWKYAAAPTGEKPDLWVTLKASSGHMLHLTVENTCLPEGARLPSNGDTQDPISDGLGTKLMTAFVAQLEGTSEVDATDGRYRLNVEFKLKEFHAPEDPA